VQAAAATDFSSSKDHISAATSNSFLNRSKNSSATKFWPINTKRAGADQSQQQQQLLHAGAEEDSQVQAETKLHEFVAEQDKNRETLQALVRMLPPHEKDDHAVSCSFVLGLLRAASMLNVGAEYKRELEKRAAMHLEQGVTLSELLIPSFSHTSEHLYDVDLVRRILEHYLAQLQQQVRTIYHVSA
jgi:hypothetical protein